MDESAPMRALTIGVSVFMAIATITAVMIYYNTAKSTAGVVGSRSVDIDASYRQDIEDSLFYKTEITGTEVINILNYFRGNNLYSINVGNIKYIKYDNDLQGCSNDVCTFTSLDNINNDLDNLDKVLKRILPNQKFSVSVSDANSEGIRVITITGK